MWLQRCLLLPVCWGAQLRAMGTTWARDARHPKVRGQAGLVLPPQLVESSYEQLAESNCIPRRWHPEGRHGICIEQITSGEHRGMRFIPLLDPDSLPEAIAELLRSGRAELVPESSVQRRSRAWAPTPPRPTPCGATCAIEAPPPPEAGAFTFAELFAGLGGFRLGLEALGGRCLFASEIERHTREVYELNFQWPTVVGDIREVKEEDVPSVDLLVGGFPCQPFSALGTQPAFEDERGLLFMEIVRILKASKAKAFLLENVPGLLDCDQGRALAAIREALVDAGYEVEIKSYNARNLTAQSRKRLFFFGRLGGGDFQWPFVPELRLRAGDILEPEAEALERQQEVYTLSKEHFEGLRASRKWAKRGGMTDTLIWEEKVCNTLVSHYGTSLTKGTSQLVPRPCPHRPRRLTVRECARLMGFPETYRFPPRPFEKPSAWFRALYKMLGNSVCPPLVAVLAGGLLGLSGQGAGLKLALEAMAPQERERVRKALHPSWRE